MDIFVREIFKFYKSKKENDCIEAFFRSEQIFVKGFAYQF